MKEKVPLKKKFGQNFLKNESIVKNIVDSVLPKKNNLVIEVGPGAGAMTKFLASKYDYVLAYEIDTDLKDELDKIEKSYSNVEIIFEDFMKRAIIRDVKKYNVDHIYFVSNLPYYITTPIINKIIELDLNIEEVVVMVQKEVADRFCAKVGAKEYNSLTVFLNYYYDIKKLFIVSRNNFMPVPNVDSAVVRMHLKEDRFALKNKNLFFKLIRDSFQFKRKTLKNNLKGYPIDKILPVLEKYDMNLNVRAEQISLEIFVEMANAIA